MMLRPGSHRRFRESLSAYIDGELATSAAERLKTHLAQCEGCRLEMEQLRVTVAALHDLPPVEAPRSFALSPERAAAGRPLSRAGAPLALGMRLATAGVAVALAAILVVDLGGLAGDGEPGTAVPQAASERETEFAPEDSAAAPDAEGAGDGMTSQTAEVQSPARTEAGGDGIDALTAAEIGLGATLGLLVLGGFALTFARRKT